MSHIAVFRRVERSSVNAHTDRIRVMPLALCVEFGDDRPATMQVDSVHDFLSLIRVVRFAINVEP